jgi:hypothetical protein
VRDLLKLSLAIAALVLIVAVMALFVSGYLKAYKSGDKGVQINATVVSGGKGGALRSTPTPTPPARPQLPQYRPPVAPEVPQMMGGMPPFEMLAPVSTPTPTPTPMPTPAFIPSTPSMSIWYYIIQDLLRIFPGLYSGPFSAFPQWPMRWI